MDWFPTRWVLGGVLAAVGLGGLFVASAAGAGPGYLSGLLVFGACVLGVFALIGGAWGAPATAWIQPLPSNGALRWVTACVCAVIAIMGLFHARTAMAGSAAYGEGLALFAVAVAYDFLLLKDWFDRRGV